MSSLEIVLRLLTALGLGAAIGFERQWHQGMAGLRTNALVSLGSGLYVIVAGLTPTDNSPTRMAAQVASGVGFLCAGVILRQGLTVTGMNTAASLWCASGVGVLAGSGFYWAATVGASCIVLANMVLRRVSFKLDARNMESSGAVVHYILRVICAPSKQTDVRSRIMAELAGSEVKLRALHSELLRRGQIEVRADLVSLGRADAIVEEIVRHMSLSHVIDGIRWEIASAEETNMPPVMRIPDDGPGEDQSTQ